MAQKITDKTEIISKPTNYDFIESSKLNNLDNLGNLDENKDITDIKFFKPTYRRYEKFQSENQCENQGENQGENQINLKFTPKLIIKETKYGDFISSFEEELHKKQ